MYSLTEIIYNANPKYLQYFSKKTGFLVADFKSVSQSNLQWLWKHIAKKFNFTNDFNKLNFSEKQKFGELLKNFGYLSQSDKTCEDMEKKIPWLFIHPSSGIFIPLEIVKLLMQEDTFYRENYLFSLLYKLKIKEQKYFTSLIGSSLEGNVNLSFESSPLDMALVLYIWLSEQIRNITNIRDIIPERGKILKSPFTFAREINHDVAPVSNLSTLIPDQPVPIWDYLYSHFSHLKEDIDKLHTLVTRGNKGFYRSVSLLKNQNSDLIRAFKNGILIPLLPTTGKNSTTKATSKKTIIKLVSPIELHYAIKNNEIKNSRSGNDNDLLGARRDPNKS